MTKHLRRMAAVPAWLASLSVAILCCREEKPSSVSQFVDAYAAADQRPSFLRIASFPYARPSRVTRRPKTPPDTSLRLAAYAVVATPLPNAGVEELRVQAAAYLVLGQVTEATEFMRRQLALKPSEALLWNDFAVALYESAARGDDPQTFAAALAAVDKAVELSPNLPEAICNRAAILEALHLRQASLHMWMRCVDAETATAWREEARSHLARLDLPTARDRWNRGEALRAAIAANRLSDAERIVLEFRQDARTWCEGEVLSEWADAHLASRSAEAEKLLKIARTVGALLDRTSGERLLRDTVEVIDRAVAHAPASDDLARAHLGYRAARIAIAHRQPAKAVDALLESEKIFLRAGSPMHLVARYYRAGAIFDTREAQPALALLSTIEEQLKPSYRALRGQVLWERSRIVGRTGDIYQSLDLSRRATDIFDRLAERVHAARMRMATATSLALLGRPREAWQLRQEIFRVISDSGAPDELERALHTLALSQLSDGHLDNAAALLEVQLSANSKLPLLRFEAQLWRTFIAFRRGERQELDAQLASLGAAAHAIADAKQRETALDGLRFADAALQVERNPTHAAALLSETIHWRTDAQRFHDLPDAYVHRAMARLKQGEQRGAINDLRTALTLLERRRLSIQALDLRDSFFASAEVACRELLQLYIRSGDVIAAFEVAERCRARGLVDSAASSMLTPAASPEHEIQRRLPARTTLLHYTVFEDHTIAFVVTSTHLRAFTLATGAQFIKLRTAGKAAHLSELHDALIAPLKDYLRATDTLIIVPDEVVANVPFSAIRERADTKPLISAARIVIAPSGSYYAATVDMMRPPLGEEILVVGDPAFDRNLFSTDRLPGAAAEARAIGSMYRFPTVLTGSEASTRRVLASVGEYDIVHIATHALISIRDASMSVLLMAGTQSDAGVLYPSQISSLRLPRAPLVILAGCRTAATGPGRGSIRGFASSFLSAGSRGVIATLWDVDDGDSVAFCRALHQRLRDGQNAVDALRATQLEMINSPEPRLRRPEFWGAFQLYGAP